MKYTKHLTVKEWKRFDKWTGDYVNGEEMTMQEIMLDRYKIILTDHKNKLKIGKMCPTPLKEMLKSLPSLITPENFDKGIKTLDRSIVQFSKIVNTISSGMGKSVQGVNDSHYTPNKKDKSNVKKLIGGTKPLWGGGNYNGNDSNKPKRRRRSAKATPPETNMDRIWGKKR